jgi:alpha-beta hydrolase superfamily lysophospholipase
VDSRDTRAWFEKTKSKEKSIKLLPKFYHELAKEPEKDTKIWLPIL